jgi:vacuolar-type H+-ATPase subunit C/Vma6
MPQSSYEYAMGRISVLTKKMLDEAQMRRIAEAADETEEIGRAHV